MIKSFEIFTPLVRGNIDFIEELAYDFVKRQAEQRVMYTEARYSPHLLAAGAALTGDVPVDARPVVDAVTRGLRRGSIDFGVLVNQILCCICWRPDWADDVVELASARRDDFPCAVVAVDIAAGEEHFDAKNFQALHEPHLKAMKKAQQLNVNITMHAGEVAGGKNVSAAIREYGATRIGHGYRMIDDIELLKELKDKQIHLETCPTSSRETGGWKFENDEKDWTAHPCLAMIENGISVSFSSDDPAVFNTSLSWQYRTVIAKMKQKKETLLAAVEAGIDAAFCSDDEKQTLRKAVADFKNGNGVTVGNGVAFRDRVIDNKLIPGESM
jgi:adenosine deaminase